MEMAELKSVLEEFKRGEQAFKDANDARLKAVEEKSADVLDEERVNRIAENLIEKKGQAEQIKALEARLAEVETAANRPGRGKNDAGQDEHKSAFVDWMRSGDGSRELKQLETKAVTVGSPAGGGHAVPEQISRDIDQLLLEISPVRNLVKVVQVSTPDYKELISQRGTASGWAGESTARAETATSTLEQVTFTHGELFAVPKASEWSLNDMFVNVPSWISMEVAEEFAFQEGEAVINGNGTNRPTGLLTATTAATGDDTRAFGTIEHIATGVAGGFAASNPGDIIWDMAYRPKAGYRPGSRWAMNKSTLAATMKLKDGQGNYLWSGGSVTDDSPMRLAGYPVTELEAMPDIATDSLSIGFGDFRKAYTMMDVVGMRMTRDEVTEKGFVLFYTRKRLGGNYTNTEAVKFIRFGTS